MPPGIKKLVILTHEAHPLASQRYFIRLLAAHWQEAGIEVKELCGPGRFEDADAAVQHVNLTVVPEEYLRLLDRYPVAVNRGTVDISKRATSENLVGPADDYPGPVIVKTNLNFGGRPEEALRARRPLVKKLWEKLREKAGRRFAPLTATTRTLKRYPIFASLEDVPRAVFANPCLVVEKFLPERRDGLYWLRKYTFFGDRHVGFRSGAREPIVKASNSVSSEPVPVPEELRAMRAAMGFDYGKFDYVVHDGRTVLLDANRTPTYRGSTPSERARSIARTLAQALIAPASGRSAGARPQFLPSDKVGANPSSPSTPGRGSSVRGF